MKKKMINCVLSIHHGIIPYLETSIYHSDFEGKMGKKKLFLISKSWFKFLFNHPVSSCYIFTFEF